MKNCFSFLLIIFWSVSLFVMQAQTPATLPYSHDFENDVENANWLFANGSQTNKWYIGTAVNNTEQGSKGLYVSNNGGVSNTYTSYIFNGNPTSYVYAYRVINFADPGLYSSCFDWRCPAAYNGLMRVFLAPESFELAAGNAYGMTSNTVIPEGWIALDRGATHTSLGGQSSSPGGLNDGSADSWRTETVDFVISTSGNYKIVFFWKNENHEDWDRLAGAVDNISISKITPAMIPYAHNFENNTENNQWILANGTTTPLQGNKWYIGDSNNTADGKSLYVSSDNGNTNVITGIATSYVYAYRTFIFENEGAYKIGFDWKANISNYNDQNILRAFLVPASVELLGGNANGMSGSSNTTPTGWIALDNGKLHINSEVWQNKLVEVNITETGNYNLVFFWKNSSNSSWVTAPAIDNVIIIGNNCLPPTLLTVDKITAENAVVSWEKDSANQWEIEYGVSGFEIGTGTRLNVTNNQITIYGLTTNEVYDVYVRTVCSEESKSLWANKTSFQAFAPTTIPYSHDFENDEENANWTLLNGNENFNKWYIGTAANNTNDGSTSLYISNDNGINNAYTTNISAHSYVYAHRTFNFSESGIYRISFDWRTTGYAVYDGILGYAMYYDLLRAFFVPEDFDLKANVNYEIDNINYELPDSWIALDDEGALCYNLDWQNRTLDVVIPAGKWKLVFFWKNTSASAYGNNPPGAVDNINISKVESATIPYEHAFEDEIENAQWSLMNGTFTNTWNINTAVNNTDGGEKAMYISKDGGVSNIAEYFMESSNWIYAIRGIYFDKAGEYQIKYDWKEYWLTTQEIHYSFMRVFLVPTNVKLGARVFFSDTNKYGISKSGAPAGWITLDDILPIYRDGSTASSPSVPQWTTQTTKFDVPTMGDYHLVFAWRHAGGLNSNPPAAVDNIKISVEEGIPTKHSEVLENNIKFYPNPVKAGELLTIETDLDTSASIIQIYNNIGIFIAEYITNGKQTKIKMPNVSGVYLIKLNSKTTSQIMKLIVE